VAELLLADGAWAEPGSLGTFLRDALPEEYVVVASPTVRGCAIDAIVIGPREITVVHAPGWDARDLAQPADREALRHSGDIEGDVRRSGDALRAFLRDEFPGLDPDLRHLVVVAGAVERVRGDSATCRRGEVIRVDREGLATAVTAVPKLDDDVLVDHEAREQLAVALRDRRLTVTQRAAQPFFFRSGSRLGSGTRVWTVREAVRHMDAHPEDGIFHLRNGTLAQWLEEQGAAHLAALARQVVRQPDGSMEAALESFLVGTGLVPRPRLALRPSRVDAGCVVQGETAAVRFWLGKGRGRGYLHGRLSAAVPWLRVEPHAFSGGPVEVLVTLETETLPIRAAPHVGLIEVASSASAEPISVPVRVRVVGLPSSLQRYLLRPALAALVAGGLGLIVGGALARWGLPPPEDWRASGLAAPAIVIGLLWAALGWLRGMAQPVAWPAGYALRAWLARVVAWGTALALVAGAGYVAWALFDGDPATGVVAPALITALLLGAALAIVPSVWGANSPCAVARPLAGPLRLALAGLVLALVIGLGGRRLAPALAALDLSGVLAAVGEWGGRGVTALETRLNDFVDGLYLDYYDRRAPEEPTPLPTSATAEEVVAPGPGE